MRTLQILSRKCIIYLYLVCTVAYGNNRWFDQMNSRFQQWQRTFPEDRVYAVSDKPFYYPGETIWFSVFVRDGNTFSASKKSEIVYAELINPKGSTEKKVALFTKKGVATGDFVLNSSSPGGLYTLKAYTNWQKNDPEPAFFEKELQVQEVVVPRLKMKLDFKKKAYGPSDKVIANLEVETNDNTPLAKKEITYVVRIGGAAIKEKSAMTQADGKCSLTFNLPSKLTTGDGLLTVLVDYDGEVESISRSIPIVLNKISLVFYPEGGDLVVGLSSRIAFKALNEFGKAADVEGKIFTAGKGVVTRFKSIHNGMGVCQLTPKKGNVYKAVITKPASVNDTFQLPEPMPKGYVLHVDNTNRNRLTITAAATRKEEMRMFMQMRGKEVYQKKFIARKGRTALSVDTKTFGMGIVQITLFDGQGIERAERIAFINKHQQAQFSVKTDKEKYKPREKVTLTITAADKTGMRMPGNVAIAVVDDQLLSFSDDKSSTILTHMYFEADLKGIIEEPRFYFDKKEKKSDKALDLLCMTHGWRRFTWEQIRETERMPSPKFHGEKMEIAGTVVISNERISAENVEVRAVDQNIVTHTDSSGKFILKGVALYEPQVVEATKGQLKSRITVRDYTDGLQLYLNDRRIHPLKKALRGQRMEAGGARHMLQNAPVMMEAEKLAKPMPALRREMPPEIMDARQDNIMEARPVERIGEKKLLKQHAAADQKPRRALAKRKRAFAPLMKEEVLPRVPPPPPEPKVAYYRAREFAFPDYSKKDKADKRSDFRSTIYWNGNVRLGNNGTATVSFYTNDAITSFRAVAEGVTRDGGVGRAERQFFSRPPFGLQVKVPPEVRTGDTMALQVLIKNYTDKPLVGNFSTTLPDGCRLIGNKSTEKRIGAQASTVIPCRIAAVTNNDSGKIQFVFAGKTFSDELEKPLRVVSQGFPVEESYSGNEVKREFKVTITNPVNHSISATFRAYPSVVSDLLTGIEAILREPYGCFEQTSMTSYPNALVLSYLRSNDVKEPEIIDRAEKLLEKGYKRLVTFETAEKGYEWFGQKPGHEALTAYGLMQFHDMAAVGAKVDTKMVNRTSAWLMKQRDGKGGFKRNPRALDSYGGADQDITDAYIVYALTEAGRRDLQKELDASVTAARKNKDAYVLALVCNALYNVDDSGRGDRLMKMLLDLQSDDGSWCGKRHSITRSGGISFTLETTALACMAIMKCKAPEAKPLNEGIQFIISSRSGAGGFGATQSTILSLKALTAYAQFARKTDAPGKIVVSVNGKDIADKAYAAGEREAIILDSLERYLKSGTQDVSVRYEKTDSPLPYSLAVEYYTWKPQESPECKVKLEVTSATSKISIGSTCRITATLTNTTQKGLPMTIAVVGIPAGLSAQPWQLKELQKKAVFDFYEITGSTLYLYYRQMKPGEVRNVYIDCKAEIPGHYTAAASRGYLYYTNEYKTWTSIPPVVITAAKIKK